MQDKSLHILCQTCHPFDAVNDLFDENSDSFPIVVISAHDCIYVWVLQIPFEKLKMKKNLGR